VYAVKQWVFWGQRLFFEYGNEAVGALERVAYGLRHVLFVKQRYMRAFVEHSF